MTICLWTKEWSQKTTVSRNLPVKFGRKAFWQKADSDTHLSPGGYRQVTGVDGEEVGPVGDLKEQLQGDVPSVAQWDCPDAALAHGRLQVDDLQVTREEIGRVLN